MSTFLFDKIIFGPVISRRLGISLGINLLPVNCKVCNFNCIYCECGLTLNKKISNKHFHSRKEIYEALNNRLVEMKNENKPLTTITYAGNGEPTLHPSFPEIIDDSIELRNRYFPEVEIAVLSNATTIKSKKIFDALNKVEKNILKLDSAIEDTIKLLNQPLGNYKLKEILNNLQQFKGDFILQTLFIHGFYNGNPVDNTSDKEIEAWLKTLKIIEPKEIMIYTIDRDTPNPDLFKVKTTKLAEIAKKVREAGFNVSISE